MRRRQTLSIRLEMVEHVPALDQSLLAREHWRCCNPRGACSDHPGGGSVWRALTWQVLQKHLQLLHDHLTGDAEGEAGVNKRDIPIFLFSMDVPLPVSGRHLHPHISSPPHIFTPTYHSTAST